MVRHVCWTPDLSVGVAELDAQHDSVLRRVDAFLVELLAGKDRTELSDEAERLAQELQESAAYEEDLMRQHAYPDHSAHVRQHAFLQLELTSLRAALAHHGATAEVIRHANRLLVGGFVRHITTSDHALGAFLQGTRAPEGG